MKVKITRKAAENSTVIAAAVERYKAAFGWIGTRLIGRSAEISALALCVLTREHFLMDGLHGIAKSRLASLFFEVLSDAKTFSLQLTEGTQADELFGPLESETYRKQAIWKRNTTNMLPDCDFAQLDEVYRASDLLLPSMMTVLNERLYKNGHVNVTCPLNTVIATCNFVTDNSELDAIHDRWLVKVKVSPLTSTDDILSMLGLYTEGPPSDTAPTLSIADIRLLQRVERNVKISREALQMYTDLVTQLRRNLGNVYISDRRLCKALKLCRAQYVLDNPQAAVAGEMMPAAFLSAATYALATVNDAAQMGGFLSAYEKTVGAVLKEREEIEEMRILTKKSSDLLSRLDADMGRAEGAKLLKETRMFLGALDVMPAEKQPVSVEAITELARIRSKVTELACSLTNALNEPTEKKFKESLETGVSKAEENEEVPF